MMNPKVILLALGSSILGQASTHADFPKPTNTQKTDLTLPTPEEAIKGMRLPGGFRVECFASEPMIRQPIAMAFDDRNRLWVAECYTYAEARTNFDLGLRAASSSWKTRWGRWADKV